MKLKTKSHKGKIIQARETTSDSTHLPPCLGKIIPLHVIRLVMRPSSLGGGRILRRTLSVRLSVCLSVRPSRYHYRESRRAT